MQSTFEYRGHYLKAITVRRESGWSSEYSVDGHASHRTEYTLVEDEATALSEGEDRARKQVDLMYI